MRNLYKNVDIDKVLIATNPLAWLGLFIIGVFMLLKKFWEWSGLNDWFFTLFFLDTLKKQQQREFLHAHNYQDLKRFTWLKRKAWNYAANKLKANKRPSKKRTAAKLLFLLALITAVFINPDLTPYSCIIYFAFYHLID